MKGVSVRFERIFNLAEATWHVENKPRDSRGGFFLVWKSDSLFFLDKIIKILFFDKISLRYYSL